MEHQGFKMFEFIVPKDRQSLQMFTVTGSNPTVFCLSRATGDSL